MSKCDCLELIAPYIEQLESEVGYLLSLLNDEQVAVFAQWVEREERFKDAKEVSE